MSAMTAPHAIRLTDGETPDRLLLWIDGVGCQAVYAGPRVSIGGPVEPGSSKPAADLSLLTNLRRKHAVIERVGESYRLETIAGAVNGRPLRQAAFLKDGDAITLGESLSFTLRVPSVLSLSAVLSCGTDPWPRVFLNGRTPGSVDSIVLMDEVCLLGPGSDAHVRCGDWEETVILFRREGQLWCRTRAEASIDSGRLVDASPLHHGAVVSGQGWRFRVEHVERSETE